MISPPTAFGKNVWFQNCLCLCRQSRRNVHVTNKHLVTTNRECPPQNSFSCDCPACASFPHQVSWNCATLTNSAPCTLQPELPACSLPVYNTNFHTKEDTNLLCYMFIFSSPRLTPQTPRTLGQGLHCGQWRPCSRLRPLHCCWEPPHQSGLQQRQDQSTATQR